jgi:hypothetical protein
MSFDFFKRDKSIPWNQPDRKAGSPDIHIDPLARKKIFGYASLVTQEISGLAYLKNINGVPTIVDPVLLKQQCSAARTELDQETVALFLEELMMDESKVADMDLLRVWWHSHGQIGVGWSGTDEATIDMLVSNNPWLLSLVVNTRGDYKCRVDFTYPVRNTIDNIKLIETPIEQDTDFLDTLKAEIEEKVSFGSSFGRPFAGMKEAFRLEDHKVAETTLGFAAEQVALSEILREQPDSFREKLEAKLQGVGDTTMCSVPIPNADKLGPEVVRLPAEHVRNVIERETFLAGKEAHDEKFGPVIEVIEDEEQPEYELETEGRSSFKVFKLLQNPHGSVKNDIALATDFLGQLPQENETEVRETIEQIWEEETVPEELSISVCIPGLFSDKRDATKAHFTMDAWQGALDERRIDEAEGETS